jgi:hypothetical protein
MSLGRTVSDRHEGYSIKELRVAVLLEKLTVTQQLEECPCFIETEISIPCSLEFDIDVCPEPDEFSPRLPTLSLEDSRFKSNGVLGHVFG